MKKQVSIRTQLVLFAVLLAASGTLWLGQRYLSDVFAGPQASQTGRHSGQKRKKRSVPVVVQTVGRAANDVTVEVIATARANRFVTLYPEVSGVIVALKVRAGERIKAGEVIVRLESRAAELAVQLARVKIKEVERKLARARHLLSNEVNSQANVDDARTALERVRLELKQAENALSKRTVKAPFDGVVGIPKVETGDRVTTTTAIVTMDERTEMLVEVEVPELYLARLRAGQNVVARTPSYPMRQFKGKIDQIDSRVNPTSRNVMFRARFPNGNDLLRPGMSFAVEIVFPGRSFPAVPELSLQWRTGQSFVWRVNKGIVEKILVRTVKRMSGFILVDGDLSQGDLVVVEGVQRLRPGRPVRFVTPKPPRAPGS